MIRHLMFLMLLLSLLFLETTVSAQGGGEEATPALWTLMFLTLILTVALLAIQIVQQQRRNKSTRPRTVVEVKCAKCGYREEKEFSRGDYVGKAVGKCPKCGGQMFIEAIYARLPKQEKKP